MFLPIWLAIVLFYSVLIIGYFIAALMFAAKVNEKHEAASQTFEEFWKEIVCNPDGSINVEQVKKELADYHYAMQQVAEVYCHITGGALSYINYPAKTVIALADDIISRDYVFKEDVKTLCESLVS